MAYAAIMFLYALWKMSAEQWEAAGLTLVIVLLVMNLMHAHKWINKWRCTCEEGLENQRHLIMYIEILKARLHEREQQAGREDEAGRTAGD